MTTMTSRRGGKGLLNTGLLTTLVTAGQAHAQFEDRPPTPPRYETVLLDDIQLPPEIDLVRWEPWSMADDGAIYGYAEEPSQYRRKMFKAKAGEETEWLWNEQPIFEEWRPIKANVDGYVLLELFGETRPRTWVFDPSRGEPVDVYRSYPTGLSLGDLNNHNIAAGTVDVLVQEDFFKAATVDLRRNVNIIGGPGTVGVEINDAGTVHALAEQAVGFSRYTVWHADGDVSKFTVPTESFIGTKAMNSRDEVVGIRMWLDDMGRFRQGGWYWSRATGVLEVPFRYTTRAGAMTPSYSASPTTAGSLVKSPMFRRVSPTPSRVTTCGDPMPASSTSTACTSGRTSSDGRWPTTHGWRLTPAVKS